MNFKRMIICGSGASIPFDNEEGIDKKLKNIVQNEYSIGINMWYKYGCETTFTTFVDYQWYMENYEEIKDLPLLIGKKDPKLLNNTHPNTIMLPYTRTYYGKESWQKGFYSSQFCTLFCMTLAIALGFKEIYLLGIDGNETNGKTHFYQDLIDVDEKSKVTSHRRWRGVGKLKGNYRTSDYGNRKKLNHWYKPYLSENVDIYNVSPNSEITVFPRISYDKFYKIIENEPVKLAQSRARERIKDVIEVRNESNN